MSNGTDIKGLTDGRSYPLDVDMMALDAFPPAIRMTIKYLNFDISPAAFMMCCIGQKWTLQQALDALKFGDANALAEFKAQHGWKQ